MNRAIKKRHDARVPRVSPLHSVCIRYESYAVPQAFKSSKRGDLVAVDFLGTATVHRYQQSHAGD
jgi:hypothetical protein